MKFSVVIPSHKRKKLLQDLLKSLQNQTLGKDQFEVIVVATEKDEAFELANDKWDLSIQFQFVPNDPTKGRSASAKRNHGAKLSKGQWIAFIDDDCLASPQWLKEAFDKSSSESPEFMEGQVRIPEPEKKTFTYKTIKRLERPGGFQTCNMFYKRKDFLKLGGFDPNFPYYLEDTDLGWTFKEAGKEYAFLEKAEVFHPVPDLEAKKILDNAFRMEKMPYLYKKHAKTYRDSQMRALPRPYFILCLFDLSFLLFLFVDFKLSLLILALRLFATAALLARMLSGCDFTLKHVTSMYYYLVICPMISLIYLMKGNLQHRTLLFLK